MERFVKSENEKAKLRSLRLDCYKRSPQLQEMAKILVELETHLHSAIVVQLLQKQQWLLHP